MHGDGTGIVDKKVRKNLGRYLFQCALATFTILAVLLFFDVLKETALIASLGASAFVIFTMPTTYSSDPQRLLGGYAVGLAVGLLFYFFSTIADINLLFITETMSLIVFGALSVGMAIFIMTVTNTEHAPAAGIALGLVINNWTHMTIIFIVSAVLWLALIRRMLRPYLMDLISPTK